MSLLSNLLSNDPQSRRIQALETEVARLRQELADERAGRNSDFVEYRRALAEVHSEAFPAAGPPGYPSAAVREIALLNAALRGTQDRLATREGRVVHGDKYVTWSVR